MGLASLMRGAVALANNIVGGSDGLQTTVTWKRFVALDGFGARTYDPTTYAVPAIEDWRQRQVRTLTGELTVCRASLTFLYPIAVDERDLFILTDGTEANVLEMAGFVDPGTGQPFATEVFLS